MPFEHREGQGSLFKNERREKESQPHARGEALIDGVLYVISAWTKEGKNGRFQSLAFKPKDERRDARPAPDPRKVSSRMDNYAEASGARELDDEVPF